jgi:hypothetical protein
MTLSPATRRLLLDITGAPPWARLKLLDGSSEPTYKRACRSLNRPHAELTVGLDWLRSRHLEILSVGESE